MQVFEDDFEDVLDSARALLLAEDDADLWEANELVNRALTLRPHDAEAWMLKAQVLSAQKDDHAALAAIEAATRKAPDSAETHYWCAAILNDLERPQDALDAIAVAHRCVTGDDDWLLEDLYCEHASTLEVLDRAPEAIAVYENALERFPDSSILSESLLPLRKQSLRASLVVLDGGKS